MSGVKRILPGTVGMLGMMVLNAVVSTATLFAVYALFGLNNVFAQHAAQVSLLSVAEKWETLWPMIPGAAIAFSALWFCLIVVGRSRGIQWNIAFFYGIGIALANVLLGGLLNGILHGNAFIGFLLGLLMLLMVPGNWVAMAIFGAVMGLFNARLAQGWIARHYPRP